MSKSSPLQIMNLMASAADKKSKKGEKPVPNDQEDPLNSKNPHAKKSPASSKKKKAIPKKPENDDDEDDQVAARLKMNEM